MIATHKTRVELSRYGLKRATFLPAGILILCILAAYSNSFNGVFVFDDIISIEENKTIRQIWPLRPALSPPRNGETVTGRPFLNVSFAINYALHGTNVWGYHAVNLSIHILNTLLLYGILRRTFVLMRFKGLLHGTYAGLALAVTLLWAIHPLQTESVTYIVQRAESLVGLFYLFTLYFVIRGAESANAVYWYILAILSCFLGMATKEVMVTAPVIVLLYDRTFLSGSFRRALGRRWGLYLGLSMAWGLLIYLVVSTAIIFSIDEISSSSPWSYAVSQPGVILHFLRQSFWPNQLCIDYGWPVAKSLGEIIPGMLVVGSLLLVTVWGLIVGKRWSFLGAWFFLILSPTSSVVPLSDLAFEHRMYLPLAAVITAVVFSGYVTSSFLTKHRVLTESSTKNLRLCSVAAVALVAGILTFQRNTDYKSEISIWQDTVSKAPENHRPHNNLGKALHEKGYVDEAIMHYMDAIRLKPDNEEAHNNLGKALLDKGRINDAIEHLVEALRINPDFDKAHNNLGNALLTKGHTDVAMKHYRTALRLNPELVEPHNNLAIVFYRKGDIKKAVEHFQTALEINPNSIEARNNLEQVLKSRKKNH